VRIKLDENLPISAGEPLQSAGHDVDSVVDEGLAGATDTNVLAEATGRDRLVITLDPASPMSGCTRPSPTPESSCSESTISRPRRSPARWRTY
jgi:predicted nuclease of predicted toxin-antitoxin system